MKKVEYPYMGFNISWRFDDRSNSEYKKSVEAKSFSKKMESDLLNILNILETYELLFVSYYLDDNFVEHAVASKFDLIKKIKKYLLLSNPIMINLENKWGY